MASRYKELTQERRMNNDPIFDSTLTMTVLMLHRSFDKCLDETKILK